MGKMIIFGIASLITLGAAAAVVTVRNILHGAFFLVLSFFGVAMIYVLLEAPFLSVVQVLIYIGAIAILIIFAVMLTHRLLSEDLIQVNKQWIWSALGAVSLFGVFAFILLQINWPVVQQTAPQNEVLRLGEDLLTSYLVPFELASVLLLAALVGAIVIARERE